MPLPSEQEEGQQVVLSFLSNHRNGNAFRASPFQRVAVWVLVGFLVVAALGTGVILLGNT